MGCKETKVSLQPMYCSKSPSNHQHSARKYCQKSKVKSGEELYVIAGLARIVLRVFPEGDKACQRSHQGAHAAYIYTYQQISVVVRKL